MRKPFPCVQCGICCQRVFLAQETQYLDRGDGVCRHYNVAHRTCNIYAARPDICRVGKQYDLHYASQCTWSTFVELNQAACAALQKQAAEQG